MKSGQRKMLARGDNEAAGVRRDQRQHLIFVFGVVHHQQCFLIVQDRLIDRFQLSLIIGQTLVGVISANDVRHRFGGCEGRVAHAAQVEEKLRGGVKR